MESLKSVHSRRSNRLNDEIMMAGNLDEVISRLQGGTACNYPNPINHLKDPSSFKNKIKDVHPTEVTFPISEKQEVSSIVKPISKDKKQEIEKSQIDEESLERPSKKQKQTGRSKKRRSKKRRSNRRRSKRRRSKRRRSKRRSSKKRSRSKRLRSTRRRSR